MADKRTPLHARHRELGGRLVSVAGYELPVSYAGGIVLEHTHTRERASLFDVSHMGQILVTGDEAATGLEALMPVDVLGLAAHRQRYALLTSDAGGVLDDLMVARIGEGYLLVVNAARKTNDLAHLQARLPRGCAARMLSDRALLALQGPAAAEVLARQAPEAASLGFMEIRPLTIDGVDCLVSRSGYTGEDGFEIAMPAADAERLARHWLSQAEVAPAGLGARDTLRLEAGLCLYGNELDETTTPVEAGLAWAIGRARRAAGARPGGYPGAEIIERQLRDGPPRRRDGLLPASRMPVRAGSELVDGGGRPVGGVTSGGFGPTLQRPIAMGYVEPACAAVGTELAATVRGKDIVMRVAPLPFVPARNRT